MYRIILLSVLTILLVFATNLFVSNTVAQKEEKDWTKWSQKDAEKMLTDSAWAQTQTDTDTSEMFFSPTSDPRTMGGGTNDRARLGQGATNQSVNVKFHVRFFSARPIRSALARLLELQQKLDDATTQRIHSFAELKASDSIILTLSIESSDKRYLGEAMQAISSAVTATLKNETYLERNGKRLFLEEYVPPGRDGFGARFIFLRTLDGRLFIDSNQGDVRFHTKYSNGMKVDRVFNVANMMYNGELEY